MSKVRKNITYMLCIVFAALVALACTMFGINNKANAADITADDFKVSKIGIRLIDDDATQSGVRFTVRAKTEILNFTDAKVTVYVLPQMFYLNGAHLKDGAAKASVIELGGEWSQDGEYSTAAAYIYDFPANNYGVKLLAEASLTYTENGTSVTKWTAITDGYSLTDVAKAAKESGVGGVDGYIVENVKITYNNADGTKISEETLAYGATLTYPEAAKIENKTQRGWVTSKSTPWNTSWTAQGNMTLTATYVTGEIIAEKMYSTCKEGKHYAYESAANIALPEGYEKVWQAPFASNGLKHGMYMPSNDLSEYTEVHFAVKTGVAYLFGGENGGTTEQLKNWIYFSLTQNDDTTWNLTVTSDGKVVHTAEKLTANSNTGEYTKNAITAILYGDPKTGYTPVGNANGIFYFTELRGSKTSTPAPDPQPEIVGEIIAEKMYSTCKEGKHSAYESAANIALPDGYEKVWQAPLDSNGQKHGMYMPSNDLSGYSEVHFAVKTGVAYGFGGASLNVKALTNWIYFSLEQNSDATWNLTVTSDGVVVHTAENMSANKEGGEYTKNAITSILYGIPTKGYTPSGNANEAFYFTELRGTKKTALAKAGTTEYKIVVPDKSENLNNYGAATRAAGELKTFFKEATGADLGDYVQDTGNLGKDIKFISIGFTNTLNNNIEGVDYDALGISGFSIKTVNGNVYISGQGMGLMNGVYEFLREHFNYEYYTDGFYKIDDYTSKEIDLKIINKEITPSFEYRLPSYGFEISAAGGYATDNMVGYRMQYNNLSIQGIGGVQWHNFFAAIAPSEYKPAHSDWFSPDGKQLCLTRDKDGLATETANKVKAVLESDKSATFVMIGQEDNDSWCTCSACKKVISQYGGYNSATYILFMNAVSDKLQPYMTENGRTDVKLGMFAYHKTQDAPVTVANGKTTLIDGMKLNANVCVVYAPIEANYYVSFNDELNSSVKKNIEGWGLVADNVLYWTYMENFGHYQLVFDNFGSLQENLKLLSENNGLWLYNLAQYNNGNSTGFSRFKAYLNAKLMWNVNADVAALTDDFFKNYFGVASDDMRRIYNEYRAVNKMKFESDNTIGTLSINGHVPSAKDYGFSNLNGWLEDIDHALAEVEKLKGVDDKEYLRVKNAVILESLSIRYTLITYFGGNFDKTQLTAMKTAWKTDAAALNVTMCGEYKTVETLYLEWGI